MTKIKQKMQKVNQKINGFEKKARAAEEELNFRKEQLEYEKRKESLKNQRDAAADKVEKEKVKQDLIITKIEWKGKKKGLINRYRSLRKAS